MTSPGRPRTLGEIVLRVHDIPSSIAFYRDVLGFTLVSHVENRFAFMRIETGSERHERIIGLFSTSELASRQAVPFGAADLDGPGQHFAYEIPLADYIGALEKLIRAGLNPDATTRGWIGWRSIYVRDPDGNTVELVAADPAVRG